MAEGIELFCTGIQGRFFNREGHAWPLADITILELGLLAREGYEDSLAVAYTSIMSHIQDLVERHQRDAGPRSWSTTRRTSSPSTRSWHPTPHPALVRYWTTITHSLEDFPESARRMLNMMEWWLCLTMESDEAVQVERHSGRQISDH
jgi:hypothetical protein